MPLTIAPPRTHTQPRTHLALVDLRGELWVDEEGGELAVAVVGALDAVQEGGADDAAALPDTRALAEVDGPPAG